MKEIKSVIDAINTFFEIKEEILSPDKTSFVEHLDAQNYILGLWFRGELDFDKSSLTPSIFRSHNGILKESLINDYLPAINEEIRVLDNPFDRLCTMQHYDIPSRLLDWSEGILTALYFAVSNKDQYEIKDNEGNPILDENGRVQKKDRDGKLYCLNAIKLNELSSLKIPKRNLHQPTDFGTLFRAFMVNSESEEEWGRKAKSLEKKRDFDWTDENLNFKCAEFLGVDVSYINEEKDLKLHEKIKLFCTPVAVMPNRIHNRLIFQNGMFTIHGGKFLDTDNEEKHPIPTPITLFDIKGWCHDSETFLKEFTIPHDCKDNIKGELMNLGIHQGSLFPELDKQKEFCLILK